MNTINGNGETLLSHWWRTDSCRQAYERANKVKAEKIVKVREAFNARREALKQSVDNWEPVQ